MNYYIFGTGKLAEKAVAKIKKYCDEQAIVGFFDNNINKQGKTFMELEVFNPNIIENLDENENCIIISSMYYFEIAKQLDDMNFSNYQMFPYLDLIENEKLLVCINKAKNSLYNKIKILNVDGLDISDYNKKYLKHIIDDSYYILNIYGEILFYLLDNININYGKINFLDYGGGTGILSLLALELGIKNVYYNDIYDISLNDSKVIAEAIGYKRSGYICGDLESVKKYCKENEFYFNLLCSFDVLEHLYDLEYFFKELEFVLDKDAKVIMCTSANSYNDIIVDKIEKGHYELEYRDRKSEFGHKQRDSLEGYLKIRKNIIKNYLKEKLINFNEEKIKDLATITRGKNKEDILKFVERYINGETISLPISKFVSNTCDPNTGNWGEHLIDFKKLKKNIENLGKFHNVQVLPKNSITENPILALTLMKL